MSVFFTGDTHFGGPRVLRLDRRPFPDLAAHDAALIAAWSERVGPADEVWHLGDFALGPNGSRILRHQPRRRLACGRSRMRPEAPFAPD